MITLREYDAARNVATYTVDAEAEIAQLPNLVTGDDKNGLGPVAMGSVVICIENMTLYMLDGNNEYVAFGSGNGGGGGGGGTPNAVQYVPQTLTDAQKLQARTNIGAASSVKELSDVDISNVADNDVLKYNEATGKWENGQIITTPIGAGTAPLTPGTSLLTPGTIYIWYEDTV